MDIWIKKVRFFLHPSFRPHDLVEVHQPPYQITRLGWGEFPLRVQIHFVDPKNKPINIIHELKLEKTQINIVCLGGEKTIDVQLDKAFFQNSIDQIVQNEGVEQMDLEEEEEEEPSDDDALIEPMNTVQETYKVITQYLADRIRESYPMISKSKHDTLPYSCASSLSDWFSWSAGKRRSSERQRAKRLRQDLYENLGIKRTTLQVIFLFFIYIRLLNGVEGKD